VTGQNGPPRRFRVDRAAHINELIRQLFQRADESGQAVEFVTAMKLILRLLRNHPREIGEPLWSFPNAQLEVRIVARYPVSVRYAVHKSALEVAILHAHFMEGK